MTPHHPNPSPCRLPLQTWIPITPIPPPCRLPVQTFLPLPPPSPPPCRLPVQTWLPTSECWLPVLHNDRTGIPSEQIIRLGAVVCQVKYYVVALPEAMPGESMALLCLVTTHLMSLPLSISLSCMEHDFSSHVDPWCALAVLNRIPCLRGSRQ